MIVFAARIVLIAFIAAVFMLILLLLLRQRAAVRSGVSASENQEGTRTDRQRKGRFLQLCAIDEKYRTHYFAPQYNNDVSLQEVCDRFRDYAASQMELWYDDSTVRQFLAGMASSQLIIIQGLEGTGKTSLPYAMGKFFGKDATIASVQPAWRDRAELLGEFNEYTKTFGETKVLKRIYESLYSDGIDFIVFDEMNIARVEYYFAEMLSVLEHPDPNEWVIEIVSDAQPSDPALLEDGKLRLAHNLWYIGTVNNDDTTFMVSDKVYDRATVINLDSRGIKFDAPKTQQLPLGYEYLSMLFEKAWKEHPLSEATCENISKLDIFIIAKMHVAFGNRIIKQMKKYVPVFVACGGGELEAVDCIMASKVFRKLSNLNSELIRGELDNLVAFMNELFGEDSMPLSKAYIDRLR